MATSNQAESASARIARIGEKMSRQSACWGCNAPWAYYGVTAATAFEDGKHIYCNADCHGAAEVDAVERAEYADLSADY